MNTNLTYEEACLADDVECDDYRENVALDDLAATVREGLA